MLGKLVLVALQIFCGWFGAPYVLKYIPVTGDVAILVHGVIFGVIVWIVGLVGSQALKDVALPSSATLAWAVVGGAIGAALVIFKVPAMITSATKIAIVPMFVPLALAIIGYALKR